MTDDTLLSSLCSICNTTKSKYRCPGCDARTCSLKCYKRHQTRALCSGQRDPTRYVKKSQLATPAGIDHDFNFITSIERGLERADKDVNERGLGAASEPRTGPRRGEVIDRQFEAAGVRVIRAPKGLSRQKENKTHRSSKKGNIVWTVEWIREDKTRLLTDTPSLLSIAEVQPFQKTTKKRKRAAEDPALKNEPVPEDPSAVARGCDPSAEVVDTLRPSSSPHEPDSKSIPPDYNFFLSRPQTNSSRRVLIPISSSSTLMECLRGRTVLEFPTIYAFPCSTSQLPKEFMLEEEYVKQEGEDQKEFEDLLKSVPSETLRALKQEDMEEQANEELDSKKLLDVLKQDLGGLV